MEASLSDDIKEIEAQLSANPRTASGAVRCAQRLAARLGMREWEMVLAFHLNGIDLDGSALSRVPKWSKRDGTPKFDIVAAVFSDRKVRRKGTEMQGLPLETLEDVLARVSKQRSEMEANRRGGHKEHRQAVEIEQDLAEVVANIRARVVMFMSETVRREFPSPAANGEVILRSVESQRIPGEPMDEGAQTNRVFVVHGRDLRAAEAVFDFLRSVGLRPIEIDEARRLTGDPSPYVGDMLAAAFRIAQAVVVLFSGDDEARLRDVFRKPSDPTSEADLCPQPRQNVLFEAGMAMGLFPKRTLIIEVGAVRPFTDLQGRHVVRLETGGPSERNAIVERLRSAGCSVETSGRDWLDRDYFRELLARP